MGAEQAVKESEEARLIHMKEYTTVYTAVKKYVTETLKFLGSSEYKEAR